MKLLMTENTKQPQDKRGLRYYTEKKKKEKVVSYKERNQQKGKVVGTDDQTLSYTQTGSSHFDHRITELPEWWKPEESNAILEYNGKGTAQAAVKAQVYSMRDYFS